MSKKWAKLTALLGILLTVCSIVCFCVAAFSPKLVFGGIAALVLAGICLLLAKKQSSSDA